MGKYQLNAYVPEGMQNQCSICLYAILANPQLHFCSWGRMQTYLFVHISCAPHRLQAQYALFFRKQDYLLRFLRTMVTENASSGSQKVLFLIVFEMEFHSSSRKQKENKNLKHFAIHSWNFESLPPSRSFLKSIKATATTSHWDLSPQRSNTKHQLEAKKVSEITAGFQDSLMTVMAKSLIVISTSIFVSSLSFFFLTPIGINLTI